MSGSLDGEKMKRIKPSDLIEFVNEMVAEKAEVWPEGYSVYNTFLLEDNLWEKKDGIYLPIGKLQLPVCAHYDGVSTIKDGTFHFGLMTALREEFAKNPGCYYDDNEECKGDYFAGMIKGAENSGIRPDELIITEGVSPRSFDIVTEHISKFLKKHDEKKNIPVINGSLQFIKKAFVDYR